MRHEELNAVRLPSRDKSFVMESGTGIWSSYEMFEDGNSGKT